MAEIAMLSVDTVRSMVAADSDQDISNAKWARTLEDIELWPDISNEANDIKRVGSIEFFENTIESTRLSFRNRILARYGQTLLTVEVVSTLNPSSLEWF